MKKLIPIIALSVILIAGCVGTPVGNTARNFENLPTNAPNAVLAQALVDSANKAQSTVPGPWTVPITAGLTLASALIGMYAHKTGVNSGVVASLQPPTAPPKV
mgnify:CR=1 FL=1